MASFMAPLYRPAVSAPFQHRNSPAAELRAAALRHPHATAIAAPGAAFDAGRTGKLAHQLHAALAAGLAEALAAVIGFATEHLALVTLPATAAPFAATTSVHRELGTAAARHPDGITVAAPAVAFAAARLRKLAHQ